MSMSLMQVQGVQKRFGDNYALADISLHLEKGEVHALVGENGAGKSTFIKVVTGLYAPDGGKLVWEGKEIKLSSPRKALELGICAVHQDHQLIPSLSGLENLYLGHPYPKRMARFGVDWKRMKIEAQCLEEQWGIRVPLENTAAEMSPSQQTFLEILRSLRSECKLLFLDEPTAALTDRETESLFHLINNLKNRGTSVIYVSHRLDEIFRLADRITVLRNGRTVGTMGKEEVTKEKLVSLMAGKEQEEKSVIDERRDGERGKQKALLNIRGMRTRDGRVKNVTFSLYAGEILGVFGLVGAGRTELLEGIYGIRPLESGTWEIQNHRFNGLTPRIALQNGMVLIPEDRRGKGLVMNMTIRENMTLPVLKGYGKAGILQKRKERQDVLNRMKALQVRATGTEQLVGELSGGNQQKIVFAKALMCEPDIFLCDEPTQGVDVMTRGEIHHLLKEQTAKGKAVLFVSSDLQEVLDVSDRLLVMREGKIVACLNGREANPEKVLRYCYQGEAGGEDERVSDKDED